MATPPGNGLRTANSVMMEIALHLVEPCVITTITADVTAGVNTAPVTSTVGMYVGAMVVVDNAAGGNPTILTITAFDPNALTVTGNWLASYLSGSTLLGATFPTQQPTDPLFTQQEILGYIARAQNEFLAKLPGIFEFFDQTLTTGITFYSLPATAIETDRVAIATSQGSANILFISRVSGLVTAFLDASSGVAPNTTIRVAGVADASFDGTYTTTTVSPDGLIVMWWQYDGSPDATSSGTGNIFTNATGELYFFLSRPLGQHFFGILWGGFTLATPSTLPSDADIQGIYAVMIVSATAEGAVSTYQYGTGLAVDHFVPQFGFIHPFIPDGTSFSSTEFYGDSIGTSLSDLIGMEVNLLFDSSTTSNNLQDVAKATAIGYAIVYNSATPTTDPQLPPPFALSPGQGLAWALPSTVVTAPGADPAYGNLQITQSSLAGGIATFSYVLLDGSTPVNGLFLQTRGLSNSLLNGQNFIIESATPTVITASGFPAGTLATADEDGVGGVQTQGLAHATAAINLGPVIPGTLTWQILSRMYEVSQQELTMRDPQWFYNTGNPIPTSWYEDRTGIYGWGVAGVPQSQFDVELMCSVRDDEVLTLTDHFVCPDIFIHFVKWKAMQFIWNKAGEQRSPTLARMASQRFDRGVMAADRYLRNVIEAAQGR